MSDAMRGTADAQQAVRMLGEMPTTPDQMSRWMSRFMPNATTSAKPEAMEDWLEDTWRMMGVVPRYRYLELLDRHEMLRSRLEKAEKDIQKLRRNMRSGNIPEQEAQKVLDLWEGMLQETLKTQSNWLKTWAADKEAGPTKGTQEDTEQVETTSEEETADADDKKDIGQ
jgi:hypothetical protein